MFKDIFGFIAVRIPTIQRLMCGLPRAGGLTEAQASG
jgi:hypothetical protein